jgi:hypothetical protein
VDKGAAKLTREQEVAEGQRLFDQMNEGSREVWMDYRSPQDLAIWDQYVAANNLRERYGQWYANNGPQHTQPAPGPGQLPGGVDPGMIDKRGKLNPMPGWYDVYHWYIYDSGQYHTKWEGADDQLYAQALFEWPEMVPRNSNDTPNPPEYLTDPKRAAKQAAIEAARGRAQETGTASPTPAERGGGQSAVHGLAGIVFARMLVGKQLGGVSDTGINNLGGDTGIEGDANGDGSLSPQEAWDLNHMPGVPRPGRQGPSLLSRNERAYEQVLGDEKDRYDNYTDWQHGVDPRDPAGGPHPAFEPNPYADPNGGMFGSPAYPRVEIQGYNPAHPLNQATGQNQQRIAPGGGPNKSQARARME